MALHLNKRESPLPKGALCQVGLNWPSGSGEEDFLNLSMYFLQFRNYLPLDNADTYKESLFPMKVCKNEADGQYQ